MDAWSRKQRAEAEAKLGEAVAILEELWQEDSKIFANRAVRWQQSEEGRDEQVRLHFLDDFIHEMYEARETLIGLRDRPRTPATRTAGVEAQPPNPQRRERPLPLLSPLTATEPRAIPEP